MEERIIKDINNLLTQLFQKMKEAGYEWDANTKELKKIEQKTYPETLDKAIELYYYSYGNGKGGFNNLSLEQFKDIIKIFIEDYGNKPAVWSEEDEEILNNIITAFKRIGENCEHYFSPDTAKVFEKTLKSLKDRVQSQPKQEWSEEECKILE